MAKKQNKTYEFNIPEKWDDITLNTFIQLQSLYNEETKPSIQQIISVLSDKTIEEINNTPAIVLNKVIDKLAYLSTDINNTVNNRITIDNTDYIINTTEQLKFGEYVDVQTVMQADKNNLPAILGIICRKEDEVYDDDYIANTLNSRIDMFSKQPITAVQPLINFFLHKWQTSPVVMTQFSENLITYINQLVTHIENSVPDGIGKKLRLSSRMRKLKKLKKSIKSISLQH